MNTNTSTNNRNAKRAIVIGASLLLLGIGTADYYNRRFGNGTGDKYAATTAIAAAPAAISVTDYSVAVAAPSTAPQPVTMVTRRKVARKEVVRKSTTTVVAGPEMIVVMPTAQTAMVEPKKDLVVELPKTFYANKQKDYSKKPGTINLAPEIGLNLSGMNNNQVSNEMRTGFHAGVAGNVVISKHWAVQPALLYTQIGGKTEDADYTSTVSGVAVRETKSLHYIQMPVNVVYKFGGWGDYRLTVGGGPYVSYLAKAVSKTEIVKTVYGGSETDAPNTTTDRVSTQTSTVDQTGASRRTDWGMGAFIGCETPKGFYSKLGGQMGLADVQRNPIDGQYGNRNYNFTLSVGYFIRY